MKKDVNQYECSEKKESIPPTIGSDTAEHISNRKKTARRKKITRVKEYEAVNFSDFSKNLEQQEQLEQKSRECKGTTKGLGVKEAEDDEEEDIECVQQFASMAIDENWTEGDDGNYDENDLEALYALKEEYQSRSENNSEIAIAERHTPNDITQKMSLDAEDQELLEDQKLLYQSLYAESDTSGMEDNINLEENDLDAVDSLGKEYRLSDDNKLKPISVPERQAGDETGVYEHAKKLMRKFLFSIVNGLFCLFEKTYWKHLDDSGLKQLVFEYLDETTKKETTNVETLITNIARYIKHEILKSYNNGTNGFTEDDYQVIENRIVFENCVVDVRTGDKLPFTHKLPYSYKISCDYSEDDLPTPNYDKFKYDATGGDQDSMDMFDLMQAYLLIPNRKGKCFFIMSYAKDSGKSSFGEFIGHYFPKGTVQKVDVEHLGDKFSGAGLERALMVSSFEMPVTRLTKSAIKAIKNFTGENEIEIEAKYKNRITANVKFKILLGSNGGLYLPPGCSDEAFYRRAIVIPFIHSTPLEQLIADMPQKWEAERSAIISKCVRKLSRFINEDGGIVFPESELSKEIKYSWQGKSMVNEKFVKEAITFTAKSEDVIPRDDLEAEYNRYYAEKVLSMKEDCPMQITKKELIKLIFAVYPHAEAGRVRTKKLGEKDSKPHHCIKGIAWKEGFGDKK